VGYDFSTPKVRTTSILIGIREKVQAPTSRTRHSKGNKRKRELGRKRDVTASMLEGVIEPLESTTSHT